MEGVGKHERLRAYEKEAPYNCTGSPEIDAIRSYRKEVSAELSVNGSLRSRLVFGWRAAVQYECTAGYDACANMTLGGARPAIAQTKLYVVAALIGPSRRFLIDPGSARISNSHQGRS